MKARLAHMADGRYVEQPGSLRMTKSMVHVSSMVLLSLVFSIPALFALCLWLLLVHVF
jgi:hypothetical protein